MNKTITGCIFLVIILQRNEGYKVESVLIDDRHKIGPARVVLVEHGNALRPQENITFFKLDENVVLDWIDTVKDCYRSGKQLVVTDRYGWKQRITFYNENDAQDLEENL